MSIEPIEAVIRINEHGDCDSECIFCYDAGVCIIGRHQQPSGWTAWQDVLTPGPDCPGPGAYVLVAKP